MDVPFQNIHTIDMSRFPGKNVLNSDYSFLPLSSTFMMTAIKIAVVGIPKPGIRNLMPDVRCRDLSSEVGSKKSGVGSRKSEVGSRKSEVGSLLFNTISLEEHRKTRHVKNKLS